jgi:hypothetical protein
MEFRNELKTNSNWLYNARIKDRIRAFRRRSRPGQRSGCGNAARFELASNGRSPEAREEIQNSGNEAKKYLKTKDITFLNAANDARFARKSAQIEA